MRTALILRFRPVDHKECRTSSARQTESSETLGDPDCASLRFGIGIAMSLSGAQGSPEKVAGDGRSES
jgi:hypothetical protein